MLYPPRCVNCDHYQPPAHGSPPLGDRGTLKHRSAWCSLHGWAVLGSSICATWQGRGEGGALLRLKTTTET